MPALLIPATSRSWVPCKRILLCQSDFFLSFFLLFFSYFSFSSSSLFIDRVVEGTAKGVVFETGDNTLMGQVARMANKGSSKTTILQMEIQRFTYIIATFAIFTASICLIVWGVWLRVTVFFSFFLSSLSWSCSFCFSPTLSFSTPASCQSQTCCQTTWVFWWPLFRRVFPLPLPWC